MLINRSSEEYLRLVEHMELVKQAIRNKVSTISKGVLIVEVANSRVTRINDDQISLKEPGPKEIPQEVVDEMLEEILYYLKQCLAYHVRFDLKVMIDNGLIKDVKKTGFNKPEELFV